MARRPASADVVNARDLSLDTDRRAGRLRAALIAVLILLFVLLIAILIFVSTVLEPAAAPATSTSTDGITWVRSIYGWGPSADEQFESTSHVAIGPDGTIWVTEYSKGRVIGFAPDGSFRRELTAGSSDSGEPMLRLPLGVAVSDGGEVFVASTGTDTVIVWSSSGEIDRVIPVPAPIQLSVRDDRLFVTSAEGLYLFTTAGEQLAHWSGRGTEREQVDLPTGALIGPDGTLYICDTHNTQIKAWSADGTSVLWANPQASRRSGMATPGSDGIDAPTTTASEESHPSTEPVDSSIEPTGTDSLEAFAASMEIPAGMTMDSAGRLVFVDPFSFSIYTANPETGEITGQYGAQGAADGQFNYPLGIAYDEERDWFAVTDSANARVQIVRIGGSGGSPLTALRRMSGPWGLCVAPVTLLIVALLVAVARRKRRVVQDCVDGAGSAADLAIDSSIDSADL